MGETGEVSCVVSFIVYKRTEQEKMRRFDVPPPCRHWRGHGDHGGVADTRDVRGSPAVVALMSAALAPYPLTEGTAVVVGCYSSTRRPCCTVFTSRGESVAWVVGWFLFTKGKLFYFGGGGGMGAGVFFLFWCTYEDAYVCRGFIVSWSVGRRMRC